MMTLESSSRQNLVTVEKCEMVAMTEEAYLDVISRINDRKGGLGVKSVFFLLDTCTVVEIYCSF